MKSNFSSEVDDESGGQFNQSFQRSESTVVIIYLTRLSTSLLRMDTMAGEIPVGLSASYWRSYSPRVGLSVNESLENGEEWIGQWDGVGLYEQ